MYNVYQHWDPLKVCVVGRSYPPEFYSWITVPHVRNLMEKIAIETEEDYQQIIKKLEEFGVEVLRPNFPTSKMSYGKYIQPPMCPRDIFIMIGTDFYTPKLEYQEAPGFNDQHWNEFYKNIRDDNWPVDVVSIQDLPENLRQECIQIHGWGQAFDNNGTALEPLVQRCYGDIIKNIQSQGNKIKIANNKNVNGAMVSRIGKDLYFGTYPDGKPLDLLNFQKEINTNFSHTRNHIVNTGGHGDGVYCPVCPGLIVSLTDIPTYAKTFPGWEVVYLPGQSWGMVKPFLDLKRKNHGKWWIPGFEYDNDVINTIETWLGHWTGYVEETVFDVNMLIIDPKNVMVFNYNKQVFDALDRYGITPHIVPFRHRYFWDGGIHCVTLDLHREGTMQDYFPNRT